MDAPQNLEAAELQRRIAAGEPLTILDVREPEEWEICRIAGATLRPTSRIREWQGEIDPRGGPYVVYCHHGRRSAQVCLYLQRLGVQKLYNLRGGIEAWRCAVDPAMPAY